MPPTVNNKHHGEDKPLRLVHVYRPCRIIGMLLPPLDKPADVGGAEFCTLSYAPVANLRVGASVYATFPPFRGNGQTKLHASPTARDIRRQETKMAKHNEPSRRGARRNRLLRMSRTEPRSRCRLVPHRPNRCCKPSLLGRQGEQGVQEGSINTEAQTSLLKNTSSCGIDAYADVTE